MSAPHHRKLWLWRNFVDGIPEYWAFGNAYPCRLGGGDPLVLGEPCGYALHIESSVGREYDDDVVLATVMRTNAMQRDKELADLRQRAERAEAERAEAQTLADDRRIELEQVLGEWNLCVKLSGSRTNGGMAAHVGNLRTQSAGFEAAQSTIADLTGQVERMREAASNACAEMEISLNLGKPSMGLDDAHELLRAALGGAA